jgi:hypothetical protein
MGTFLVLVAALVGIPAMILGMLDYFPSWQPKLEPVIRWLRQFRPWQLGAAVVVAALVFAAWDGAHPGPLFLVAGMFVLGLFFRSWRDEFLFLMSRTDADFPGHYDRAIWAIFMITMAPVGLWFFRSYHLAHWPEPKAERAYGRAASDLS